MLGIPKPVILMVMDGWGIAPPNKGNAITNAKTPNFEKYSSGYWCTQLQASGEWVGLPHGEDGNSEVGHINMGAGRIVYQDLPRINLAIADGSFLKNEALLSALRFAKDKGSRLHLMGLIGLGGVHSSLEHLYALLWMAKEHGFRSDQVLLDVFTDGRDCPPNSAPLYLNEIENRLKEINLGRITSLCGRYFAMDRDNRWERTEKAYRLLTSGEGEKAVSSLKAVEAAYSNGKTDEFILPTVITDKNGVPYGPVKDGDAVIFFNFRPDRARQLTKAFVFPDFTAFKRPVSLKDVFFVSMTEYERGLPVSAVAFPSGNVEYPLSRVISERGKKQLHIAETEKYPHVTYYFNGGREDPFPGEDRVLIPSPKVDTYDQQPEMSAFPITDIILKRIALGVYDFILVNYANPDMVGHTGVLEAGIQAVETVDTCLGKVVDSALIVGGMCLLTADHGNVEEMINLQTGEVDTEHSTNPVPFVAVGEKYRGAKTVPSGILADLAPTICGILGITRPSAMTGRDLLS